MQHCQRAPQGSLKSQLGPCRAAQFVHFGKPVPGGELRCLLGPLWSERSVTIKWNTRSEPRIQTGDR